jgi:hypothetical protein
MSLDRGTRKYLIQIIRQFPKVMQLRETKIAHGNGKPVKSAYLN